MSGGSFNYACWKASGSEVFVGLADYKAIEQWLRGNNKHNAADEVFAFILLIETCQRRLHVAGDRLELLLQKVEWCASGDVNIDAVDKEYEALISNDNDIVSKGE